MSKKKYICPVCGFEGLKESPYNQENVPSYEICPCCGFEFGFDGANSQDAFIAFRQRWIEQGASWFMPKLKPKNWNLQKQLGNLNKKESA
jgi:hypothetical protein